MDIRRPKNPWSLLTFLCCLLGIAGSWVGIILILQRYRGFLYPADAFLSGGTRVSNIFLYVTPLFPSLVAGIIVGNFLLWCIPPARAEMETSSAGKKRNSYRSTQITLAKFAAILTVIALPICLMAANHIWALSMDRIDYRPALSFQTASYRWSDVKSIETGCYMTKSLTLNFLITLTDGTKIDVMEESPSQFLDAYPQVQAALHGKRYTFSRAGLVGSCVAAMPRRYLEILARKPESEESGNL